MANIEKLIAKLISLIDKHLLLIPTEWQDLIDKIKEELRD